MDTEQKEKLIKKVDEYVCELQELLAEIKGVDEKEQDELDIMIGEITYSFEDLLD